VQEWNHDDAVLCNEVWSTEYQTKQTSSIHDAAADRQARGMPYMKDEKAWLEVQDLVNAGVLS
jgi:hypothetical protein